jgi:hypothetical protein
MATTEQAAAITVSETSECPTCSTPMVGNYCHACGEKKPQESDLTFKHLALQALNELTSLDSRIFRTVRYLFTRPGFLSEEYIVGRRRRYLRPFTLFLISSGLFLIASSMTKVSGYDVRQMTAADTSHKIDEAWDILTAKKGIAKDVLLDRVQATMDRVVNAANIANVLAMALLLALLYRRSFFGVHLIVALHFQSFTYLATILVAPVSRWAGMARPRLFVIMAVTTICFFVYLVVCLRRIYRESMTRTILKSILIYAVTQAVIIFTFLATLMLAIASAVRQ